MVVVSHAACSHTLKHHDKLGKFDCFLSMLIMAQNKCNAWIYLVAQGYP
jgi:hypothetical protein